MQNSAQAGVQSVDQHESSMSATGDTCSTAEEVMVAYVSAQTNPAYRSAKLNLLHRIQVLVLSRMKLLFGSFLWLLIKTVPRVSSLLLWRGKITHFGL